MNEPVDGSNARDGTAEPSAKCAASGCENTSSVLSHPPKFSVAKSQWMTAAVIAGLVLLNVGIFFGEGFSSQSIRTASSSFARIVIFFVDKPGFLS